MALKPTCCCMRTAHCTPIAKPARAHTPAHSAMTAPQPWHRTGSCRTLDALLLPSRRTPAASGRRQYPKCTVNRTSTRAALTAPRPRPCRSWTQSPGRRPRGGRPAAGCAPTCGGSCTSPGSTQYKQRYTTSTCSSVPASDVQHDGAHPSDRCLHCRCPRAVRTNRPGRASVEQSADGPPACGARLPAHSRRVVLPPPPPHLAAATDLPAALEGVLYAVPVVYIDVNVQHTPQRYQLHRGQHLHAGEVGRGGGSDVPLVQACPLRTYVPWRASGAGILRRFEQ